MVIQYPYHCLLQYLHKTDSVEFSVPLWDQDSDMPVTLLCKVTLTEGGLDHPGELLPVIRVRILLPYCLPQTGPEVLHPHPRRYPDPVPKEAENQPGYVFLLRDEVCH